MASPTTPIPNQVRREVYTATISLIRINNTGVFGKLLIVGNLYLIILVDLTS